MLVEVVACPLVFLRASRPRSQEKHVHIGRRASRVGKLQALLGRGAKVEETEAIVSEPHVFPGRCPAAPIRATAMV